MIYCKAECRLLDRTNITAMCEQTAGARHGSHSRWSTSNENASSRPTDTSGGCFSPFFLLVPLSFPFFFPPPSFPLLPSLLPPLLQRNHMEIGKNDANELTCKTDSQIKGTDLWLPNRTGVGEGWSRGLELTYTCVCKCGKLLQSCLTLCDSMVCSPPGSSVRGILQAGILEWVACPPPADL